MRQLVYELSVSFDLRFVFFNLYCFACRAAIRPRNVKLVVVVVLQSSSAGTFSLADVF